MKRTLIAAACLALLAPAAPMAQPMQGPPTTRPSGPMRPQPVRPNPSRPNPSRPNPSRPEPSRPHPSRPDPSRPPSDHKPPPWKPPHHRPPHHWPPGHRPPHGWKPGHRPPGWRPGHDFCFAGRCRPRFHAGFYRWPSGFSYRRWTTGETLPLAFLSGGYYFAQWASLGLDAPPPGYQWVRYGSDLLLVDTRSGRIVDVAYGAVY